MAVTQFFYGVNNVPVSTRAGATSRTLPYSDILTSGSGQRRQVIDGTVVGVAHDAQITIADWTKVCEPTVSESAPE
jgi:hypothetical protein